VTRADARSTEQSWKEEEEEDDDDDDNIFPARCGRMSKQRKPPLVVASTTSSSASSKSGGGGRKEEEEERGGGFSSSLSPLFLLLAQFGAVFFLLRAALSSSPSSGVASSSRRDASSSSSAVGEEEGPGTFGFSANNEGDFASSSSSSYSYSYSSEREARRLEEETEKSRSFYEEEEEEEEARPPSFTSVLLSEFACPPGQVPEAKENKKCKPMKEVWKYFPSKEYYLGKRAAYPDLTRIFEEYEGRECTSPKNVRVHANPGTGFGAIVMYSIYQFGDAVGTRKGPNVYDFSAGSLQGFAGKSCGSRSLRCYLKPLSKCDIQTINRGQTAKLDPQHRAKQHVPAEARSFFSWHAALSNRLWRPNDEFALKIAELKKNMNWPDGTDDDENSRHRVISIHVRKGDACATKKRVQKSGCANFAKYAERVEELRNEYPNTFTHVFLATDDEATIREAEAYCEKHKLSLMYAPVERSWYHPKTWSKTRGKFAKKLNHRQQNEEHFKAGFIERRLRAGDGDPARIGMETAADVELLASGHAFIGTFTSNMGRLAFEIMTDRLKRVPPYVSVDGVGWKYGQSDFVEKKKNS